MSILCIHEEWRVKTTVLPFKGDTEVAASRAPCGARGAKKRKVSSTKDSEDSQTGATGSEQQQPDIKDEAPVHGDTGQ